MASSSTSSTQRARPQSANPSRRTRTASSIHHHHKSADLEEHPITAPATTPEEDAVNKPITNNQVVVPNITKISSPTPYDSLVTFECIQKASALRVLAKTLDRQRDVSSSNQNATESSSSEVEHHRSSTAQPRNVCACNVDLYGTT